MKKRSFAVVALGVLIATAAYAQSNAKKNGTQATMSFHDAPVVVSDNSVRVTVNTYFADLSIQPPNMDAKTYASVLKYDPFIATLVSHTHAACPQSIPVKGTNACNTTCTPNSLHTLYVFQAPPNSLSRPPGQQKPVAAIAALPLTDCDTITLALEKYDTSLKKWVGGKQLVIKKRYVPIEAYPKGHTAVDPSINLAAQQQAWAVQHTGVPMSAMSVSGIVFPDSNDGAMFETVDRYRLQTITVSGSEPIKASDSCTAVVIQLTNDKLTWMPPCVLPISPNPGPAKPNFGQLPK